MHTIRHEGQGIYLELSHLSVGQGHSKVEECNEQLRLLLQKHDAVLNMPAGLSTHKVKDHRIILQDGTGPISVWPYRYPYFQKNEIEKLVREMLAAGIIQTSTSPFSSPVLLVKKKDGS